MSSSNKASNLRKSDLAKGKAAKQEHSQQGQQTKLSHSQQKKKGGQSISTSSSAPSALKLVPERNERGETRFEERERIAREADTVRKQKISEAVKSKTGQPFNDMSNVQKLSKTSRPIRTQQSGQKDTHSSSLDSAQNKPKGQDDGQNDYGEGKGNIEKGEKEGDPPDKKQKREGEEPTEAMKRVITVHINLKDTMFYLK